MVFPSAIETPKAALKASPAPVVSTAFTLSASSWIISSAWLLNTTPFSPNVTMICLTPILSL
jgi:hypothetical protein